MSLPISLLADSSSNLLAARTQMGFTLGFHIVLACLGVAFPAAMLIAEWHGHRKKDPEALRLARNWSKAVAVLFAVGAVTGTVLSFEFGLLWPRFTGRFGDAFGVGFAIEGIFFFLEAIFIAIYIYGWDRLSPRAHMLAAVPIVISGVGGAFSVIAVNAWMNQPQGFDLDSRRQRHPRQAPRGALQPGDRLRVLPHVPGGLHRHRLSDRLRVRGRDAPWPP